MVFYDGSEMDDFRDEDYNRDNFSEGVEQGRKEAQAELLANMSESEILALIERSRRESIVAQLPAHDNYGTEVIDEDGDLHMYFSDPGGVSSLRAASAQNPRILPCPDCGTPDVLTPADRARGYCCNTCASRNEGTYVGWDY